jgi:hypothetical protein
MNDPRKLPSLTLRKVLIAAFFATDAALMALGVRHLWHLLQGV